jgi:hypothetical protein
MTISLKRQKNKIKIKIQMIQGNKQIGCQKETNINNLNFSMYLQVAFYVIYGHALNIHEIFDTPRSSSCKLILKTRKELILMVQSQLSIAIIMIESHNFSRSNEN